MSEARLTDVESSMAFLEKTVQDLSGEVRRQQEEIDLLNGKLQLIAARVERVESPEQDESDPQIEKPPHY